MIHPIVNRYTANLTNCESEPIHIPGSIQPFGFLLGIGHQNFIIEYCSANVDAFTGMAPEALLGNSINVLFDTADLARLQQYLIANEGTAAYPFTVALNGKSFTMQADRKDKLLLLEFEPSPIEALSLDQLYGQMRRFAAGSEQAGTLQELCQLVAAETRAITGFDRVMIYRFDKDYNGEVIAESKREDLEAFLNLHYPHTDIPAQARQLYLQNLVRLIADVAYTPVPILTLNALADHKAVDLSQASLRSVSPIHIEYLKNMGVGASFSVSLVHEGKLWGLIACHHYGPKVLPHHTRLAAQLQGHFLTSQIRVQEAKDAHERTQAATTHLQQLQRILLNAPDFVEELCQSRHLLQLVHASGVLIVHGGRYYKSGSVPGDDALRHLVSWLAEHTLSGHLQTDSIVEIYPRTKALGPQVAGLLFHSLGASELNSIVWFRPEVAQTVHWAGNPEEAMREKATGARLSPRKSFASWKQEVRYRSEPWNAAETAIAASFAYALQKQVHLALLARDEARYRRLSEQLTEANEELSRINWISTHDLKEPLRKIQMFGSRILESDKDQLSEMVENSVTRMRQAASRMQKLLDDIMLYSRMTVKDDALPDAVLLDAVVDEVLAELKDELEDGLVQMRRRPLPAVTGISVQLQQLFRNLISNSVKFAAKDRTLTISIDCDIVPRPALKDLDAEPAERYYHITVSDNGIGFEEIYANRIFDVFQRLHTVSEYPGTGIGLAICRKIMQNHNGTITAAGAPGEGATFHLYFPVAAV